MLRSIYLDMRNAQVKTSQALCFKRNEVLNSNSLHISNTCTNIRNKRDVVPVKAQHC